MATERQVWDVMCYIAADSDVELSTERHAVWYDQFKHITLEILMAAARLVVSRKIYGKFPRCSDFWDVVWELQQPNAQTWGDAWDEWVELARRYSLYDFQKAVIQFEQSNPFGARALGSMAREYFSINTVDIPTFRAQFRQRYESMRDLDKKESMRPSDLQRLDGNTLKLVQKTARAIGGK